VAEEKKVVICWKCKERPAIKNYPCCAICLEQLREMELGQPRGRSGGSMTPGGRMLPQGDCGHCFAGPVCPVCGTPF